jgi:hypothetical protein
MKTIRTSRLVATLAVVGLTAGFGVTRAFGDSADEGPRRLEIDSDGQLADPSRLPEFVETLDRDGNVVGYSRMSDILVGPSGPPGSVVVNEPTPVYGPDLHQIVGHMYPGYGFVPSGEAPPPE